MKKFWKYLTALTCCGLLIATAADAQFYYPYGGGYNRHRYNRYNNNDNDNQRQYRTYSSGNGEHPFILNLNYAVAGPLGSLHDYVGKVSPRGWNISGIYTINKNWGVGLTGGFNDFYEKIPRQVYHESGSDISAVQSHVIQTIPILATGVYTFNSHSLIKPYLALGAGVDNVSYQKWWGEFQEKKNSWQFAVSPEAGLKVPFGKNAGSGVNVGVKYNYAPYSYNELSNLSSWEGNIGVYFHLH